MIRRPPRSTRTYTLFPYTTLFRSESGEKPIHALMARGVEYIEVRNTDINPFLPLGIDQTQADFLDLFLLTCLLMEEREISVEECDQINENHDRVVTRGREPGLTLVRDDQEVSLKQWGDDLLLEISKTATLLDQVDAGTRYQDAIATQQAKLDDASLTPSAQILAVMQADELKYSEFVMQQAQQHREELLSQPLTDAQLQAFNESSQASLEAQRQIEAADEVDFDTYLENYAAS